MSEIELSLYALNRSTTCGWMEYEPVAHITIYRTWHKQVIPKDHWRFDLLLNWNCIEQNVSLVNALAFLEGIDEKG